MSLKSNYAYIRDWINTHFLKKTDVDLTQYSTHEEVSDKLESYAEKSELNEYLTVNDYKIEENIIATALTDLDNRTDGVIKDKEEKVITISLLDLNSRINNKESVDNKVTSISSSSTHDEYPSAKCMYDRIIAIETRLSQLEQNQGS